MGVGLFTTEIYKNNLPEIKSLKQKVRDIIAPDENLGHINS